MSTAHNADPMVAMTMVIGNYEICTAKGIIFGRYDEEEA